MVGHRTEAQGGDTAAESANCGKRNILLYVPRLSPRRQDIALFLVTATVGLLTGLLVGGYEWLTSAVRHGYDLLGWLPQVGVEWWRWVAVPVVGGVGIALARRFVREGYGAYGVAQVMRAVRGQRAPITFQEAVGKVVLSAWTIGSGGSVGREGPAVEVGAAVATRIGGAVGLGPRRCAILLAAGSAAGIAAIFQAPLAGMAYAFEIVVAEITLRTSGPIILAAVVGSLIAQALGTGESLTLPPYQLLTGQAWWFTVPLMAGLSLVAAAVAALFTNGLRGADLLFRRLPLPGWLLPLLGFLLLGCLLVATPEVFGTGVTVVEATLREHYVLESMVGLLLAKMVATSLTLAAGGVGGLFGPSLFLGAVAGGAYGMTVMLWTSAIPHYGIYAVLGMGAVLGAVIRAPITATMIVFEVTGDYRLVVPLLLITLFAILLTRWMSHRSIYTGTTEIHPEADPSLQTLGFPRADGVTEPKAGWER